MATMITVSGGRAEHLAIALGQAASRARRFSSTSGASSGISAVKDGRRSGEHVVCWLGG
ncbi:MAG: hypothetical protein ACLUE1_07830 [Adlercreutzia equolifaciens]